MPSPHPLTPMQDASVARIRELLSYDPETGLFSWRKAFCPKIKTGAPAGTRDDRTGYLDIRVDGKKYRAHRVAFVLMTGDWPADLVDHASGDRSDNRWSNLRQCNKTENNQNTVGRPNGSTGVKGVRLTPEGRYEVRIQADGIRRNLGSFNSLDAAASAYGAAARDLHGEFARTK